ncbi:MAG: hypothetical protein ACRCW2_16615 [Cellulosilyticaceae bacterium]
MRSATPISYTALGTDTTITTALSDGCFDGDFYYFVDGKTLNAFKYSSDFKLCETFKTPIIFQAITYDPIQKCFWAYGFSSQNHFYKLGPTFKQIDTLTINPSSPETPTILTLAFDCKCHYIVATTHTELLYIDLQGRIIHTKTNPISTDMYLSAFLTYDATLILGQSNANYYLHLICQNEKVKTFSIPNLKYTYKAMITLCCLLDDANIRVQLLANTCSNCSYIIQFDLDLESYKCCVCPDTCTCCCSSPEHTPCCPCNALCEILTSIALAETSLSHILNAEGEKLQKGIALSCNVCDLIALNKSVENTLSYVIQLETTLTNKLRETLDYLSTCKIE